MDLGNAPAAIEAASHVASSAAALVLVVIAAGLWLARGARRGSFGADGGAP